MYAVYLTNKAYLVALTNNNKKILMIIIVLVIKVKKIMLYTIFVPKLMTKIHCLLYFILKTYSEKLSNWKDLQNFTWT